MLYLYRITVLVIQTSFRDVGVISWWPPSVLSTFYINSAEVKVFGQGYLVWIWCHRIMKLHWKYHQHTILWSLYLIKVSTLRLFLCSSVLSKFDQVKLLYVSSHYWLSNFLPIQFCYYFFKRYTDNQLFMFFSL